MKPIQKTFFRKVQDGDVNGAKALLALGADVNATDEDGFTSIQKSIKEGNEAMFEMLFEKGADLSHGAIGLTQLFHVACESGNLNFIKKLIDLGFGVCINDCDSSYKTALYYASCNGDKVLAELLIAKGASVEIVPASGNPKYSHIAKENGHIEFSIWIEELENRSSWGISPSTLLSGTIMPVETKRIGTNEIKDKLHEITKMAKSEFKRTSKKSIKNEFYEGVERTFNSRWTILNSKNDEKILYVRDETDMTFPYMDEELKNMIKEVALGESKKEIENDEFSEGEAFSGEDLEYAIGIMEDSLGENFNVVLTVSAGLEEEYLGNGIGHILKANKLVRDPSMYTAGPEGNGYFSRIIKTKKEAIEVAFKIKKDMSKEGCNYDSYHHGDGSDEELHNYTNTDESAKEYEPHELSFATAVCIEGSTTSLAREYFVSMFVMPNDGNDDYRGEGLEPIIYKYSFDNEMENTFSCRFKSKEEAEKAKIRIDKDMIKLGCKEDPDLHGY